LNPSSTSESPSPKPPPSLSPSSKEKETCRSKPKFSVSLLPPTTTGSSEIQPALLLKQGGFFKPKTMAFPVLRNGPLNLAFKDSMLEMELGPPSPIDEQEKQSLFTYETGDHLAVYPINRQAIVERLAERCNLSLDEIIHFDPSSTTNQPFPNGLTVRQALSSCIEIESLPTPTGMNQLALNARDQKEREILESFSRNPARYKETIWGNNRHLPDLLEEFPSVQLSLSALLQVAPTLQPRYYSISSSSAEHPTNVHLTYRWVHYAYPPDPQPSEREWPPTS